MKLIKPRPHLWHYRRWLRPAAGGYAAAIRLRNLRYDRIGGTRVSVPVISIGNITVGGTGKTPTVATLVQWLREQDERPAILTRGYAAPAGQTADEVEEYHARAADVPVVVNPDRIRGARSAIDEHDATVLVLDDGFQHRRLARDVDIVLLDGLNPWGGDALLPEGRLREPLSALQRADLIVITRANQITTAERTAIEQRLAVICPGIPMTVANVEPSGWGGHDSATAMDLADLSDKTVQPVCAIGNPETFVRSLLPLASAVRYPIAFPDHHRYTEVEVAEIIRAAAWRDVDVVVTTGKDWGKLAPRWPADARPLLRLDVAMHLPDAEAVFAAVIKPRLGDPRA